MIDMSFAGEDAKQTIPPYQRKAYDGGYPSLRPTAPGRPSKDLITRDDTHSEISSEYFSLVHVDEDEEPTAQPSSSTTGGKSRLHSEAEGERHDDVKRSRSTPHPEVQHSAVQHTVEQAEVGTSTIPDRVAGHSRLHSQVDSENRDHFKRYRINSLSVAHTGKDAQADFQEVCGGSEVLT